jgi:hypothetical protein
MSKLGAPLTPYALAEVNESHHTSEQKRYLAIKKLLLNPKDIDPLETWSSAHAQAIHEEARTLVLKQHCLSNDLKPLNKGLRSSRVRQSTVTKVNLSFIEWQSRLQAAQGGDTSGISNIVQKLGLIDLTKEPVTFRLQMTPADNDKRSTNVIHVKRNSKSAHTKSIQLELGAILTYQCVEEPLMTVYVSTNPDMLSAHVKLECKSPGEADAGQTWINECVLIFNQESKITSATLVNYGVALNKAMSEERAHIFNDQQRASMQNMLQSVHKKNDTHEKIGAYFAKKISMYSYVARDPSDQLKHDKYIQCFRTVLHEHRRLHLTYAYLRGMAAVLMRELSDNEYANCSFDCIVNAIQNAVDHSEEVKQATPQTGGVVMQSLLYIIRVVDGFMLKLIETRNKENTATIEIQNSASKVYQSVTEWLERLNIATNSIKQTPGHYFGSLLAVYIFECAKSAAPDMKQSIAWLKDETKETVSGTEWVVSFNTTFHVSKLYDPRKIFDGVELISWIQKYNLFTEEKCSNDLEYKHMFRVKYTAKQKLRLVVLHPYTDLHPATVPC